MKKILILASVFILSASQASIALSSSYMNSTINVSYGTVENIGRTKVKSKVGKGIMLGGILGALSHGKKRGKHALNGALAGGVVSSILQGHHKAYSYLIQTVEGGDKRVITEQGGIRVGDCVSIEEGKMTNVRRVSMVHCKHYQHEVMAEPMVHSKITSDAAGCHTAKSILLKANTEAEMDIAMKKVKIFCD